MNQNTGRWQALFGSISPVDSEERRTWIVGANRGDGKRFIVRADDELTAFLELERAVCIHVLTGGFELNLPPESPGAWFLKTEATN